MRRLVMVCLVLIAGVYGALKAYNLTVEKEKHTFSQYMSDVQAGSIKSIEIMPDYFSDTVVVHPKNDKQAKYTAIVPRLNIDALSKLTERGVAVSYPSAPVDYSKIINDLVMLAMLGYLVFMLQQSMPAVLTGGPEAKSNVKFSDVAGAEEAKRAMQELVNYLSNPQRFERLGARFPKGFMLYGDPGNGKTLLARAVAGEAGVPFLEMSGSDFGSMFISVSGSRVKKLFSRARACAPCVVFIDEIDAIGGRRMTEGSAAAREMGSTLNQLLVQMDGFTANTGVVVIAATNRLDALDPALLRSGRFDRHIQVQAPTADEREEILKVHSREVEVEPDFDFKAVARHTLGMSGADLANVINKAAMIAASSNSDVVTTAHALQATDDILMGETNTSLSSKLDEKTRRVIARHESSHAVVAMAFGLDPVTFVSIVSRSRSLGVTLMSPEADRRLHDAHYIRARLAIYFAGRTGEELFEKICTTGAEDDIAQATRLATDMVKTYGMSDFGMIRVTDETSPQMRYEADQEILRLLRQAKAEATAILESNESLVADMTTMLVEKEEIRSREDLEAFRERVVMPENLRS